MSSAQSRNQPYGSHPALETIVVTRSRDIVEGFNVRRVLPDALRRKVGPFIFLDQMGSDALWVGNGLDVAPHIGLATVIYLFEGELLTARDIPNLIALCACDGPA